MKERKIRPWLLIPLILTGCGSDFTTSENDSGVGGALASSEPTEDTPDEPVGDTASGGTDSTDDGQPGSTGGAPATGGAWYGNIDCPESEACEIPGGPVMVATGGTTSTGGTTATGGAPSGPPQCGDGDCPHWQDSDAQTGGQCVSEIYNLNYEEWIFVEGKSWDLNCGPRATSQYCWDWARTNNYERCP